MFIRRYKYCIALSSIYRVEDANALNEAAAVVLRRFLNEHNFDDVVFRARKRAAQAPLNETLVEDLAGTIVRLQRNGVIDVDTQIFKLAEKKFAKRLPHNAAAAAAKTVVADDKTRLVTTLLALHAFCERNDPGNDDLSEPGSPSLSLIPDPRRTETYRSTRSANSEAQNLLKKLLTKFHTLLERKAADRKTLLSDAHAILSEHDLDDVIFYRRKLLKERAVAAAKLMAATNVTTTNTQH